MLKVEIGHQFNMLNVVERGWTKIETSSIGRSTTSCNVVQLIFAAQQMLLDFEPRVTSLKLIHDPGLKRSPFKFHAIPSNGLPIHFPKHVGYSVCSPLASMS